MNVNQTRTDICLLQKTFLQDSLSWTNIGSITMMWKPKWKEWTNHGSRGAKASLGKMYWPWRLLWWKMMVKYMQYCYFKSIKGGAKHHPSYFYAEVLKLSTEIFENINQISLLEKYVSYIKFSINYIWSKLKKNKF